MFKARKRLFTGVLLGMLLLTACGSGTNEATVPVASAETEPGPAVQSFTGKISSISGTEITLYKAVEGGVQAAAVAEPQTTSDDPAEVSGAEAGQAAENTGGETGAAAEGAGSAAGNTAGSAASAGSAAGSTDGDGGTQEAARQGSGEAPGMAGGDGQGGAPLQFGDELLVIAVDDDTQYVGAAGDGEASAAGTLTLAGLKAGDVIVVTLQPDSLTAAVIEVQAAGVTGGGNMTPEASPGASPSPQQSPGADGQPLTGEGAGGKPQQSPGAAPGGGAGQAPAGDRDGGKGGTPPSGAPGGGAGAGGAPDTAGAAAQPAAGGKPAAGASASAKPAATAGAGASANPAATADAGASAKPAATAGSSANPDGEAGPGAGMSIGKIKSISGSSITLYIADTPSAPAQNGAASDRNAGGAAPSARPGASPGAANGEQPGERPQGGGQMSFSETTKVITVSSGTKLLAVTFDNGTRSEAALALSALKAGDIIQFTLKTGTTEAESITLSSGGPGGTP